MKRSALERFRQIVYQVRSRFARRGLILMYHRVADVCLDPWSLCVTPRHFAEHLEVLREYGRPMHLQQLIQALGKGNLPQRAVVVTFDDGYADNLHNAKPLLERYDIPATIFTTTVHLGQEREFWWDELERLLLQPGTLPQLLRLSVNGSAYQWELGEAAHYNEDVYRRYRYWRAWEDTPSPRHSLYCSLWQLLRPLPEGERRKALDELMTWAGTEPAGRLIRRPLLFEEVFALAQGKLVEIGSHTMTHPMLSSLSLAAQRDEIRQSKAYLEEALERPVTSFAYPYGCYTAETVATVREAGFDCACSASAGIVRQYTDRFQLPRFHVQDWDGEEFARQLSLWFSS